MNQPQLGFPSDYPLDDYLNLDAMFPSLSMARALTMHWLIPALADRFDVPCDNVLAAMRTLPTNYAPLLDSAQGVSAISAAAGMVLGVDEAQPFMPGIH